MIKLGAEGGIIAKGSAVVPVLGGLQVQASLEALHCVLEQDTLS